MNVLPAVSDDRGPQLPASVESPPGRIAIMIPTLNEAENIISVLREVADGARRLGAAIVVVDGGSTDRTVELVRAEAERNPAIALLSNPRRLQAAAINLAVAHFHDKIDWFIRLDAHASYPQDYCEVLLEEARRTGADSVVVRMRAAGCGLFQRNVAAAQNTLIGNGGSPHRANGQGRFVEHGHHALMRNGAFLAVGGYDEAFSQNEDAELDQRLIQAGYRIWLTGATCMEYYPRDTLPALARQYHRFGAGRFETARKHPRSLNTRHFVLIGLAPIAAMAALSAITPVFALPLLLWLAACVLAGASTAIRLRRPEIAICGLPAAVMQMTWSFGFWDGLIRHGARRFESLFRLRRT